MYKSGKEERLWCGVVQSQQSDHSKDDAKWNTGMNGDSGVGLAGPGTQRRMRYMSGAVVVILLFCV